MWTIVEVIYGFEGILICSDRTQCEVCFETKGFFLSLSLSLSLSFSPSLLSAALPVLCMWERGWAPRSGSVLGICLWAVKCPSNEDNDGETASLAIFLMTADVFILSVTPRREAGGRCGAFSARLFFELAFWYFVPAGIRNSGYLPPSCEKHNRSSRWIA